MTSVRHEPPGPQEGPLRRARANSGGESGLVVLAAATLLMVLAVAALVADAGIMLMGRTDVSMAVDASALAGARDLPDQAAARTVALDYLDLNINRPLYLDSTPTISFPAPNVIRVHASMGLPPMFTRVLGFTNLSVAAVAEATRFDPDIALIIDRSESMCFDSHGVSVECPPTGPWEPFSTIQSTATQFVNRVGGDSTFVLISFATESRVDVAPTQNRAFITSAIDTLQPDGYTNTAASVNEAVDQLLDILGPNPKLIVLLTDGHPTVYNGEFVGPDDPRPREDLRAAARAAADQGVVIHGINYGNNVDNALMQEVAEITNGRFYAAPDGPTLQLAYDDIANQVHVRLTFVD